MASSPQYQESRRPLNESNGTTDSADDTLGSHRVRMPESSLYNDTVYSEDLATPAPDEGACGNPHLPKPAICDE